MKKINKKFKLRIGAWNVRTLQDSDQNTVPERKTAIISRLFQNLNLDIVALSETRFPDESQLEEVGGGYTFFWKGRPIDECRQSGVGFAIKSSVVRQLSSFPMGISDRIMTLRLSIGKDRWATLISVYAPTMTNSEQTISDFYQQLSSTISKVPFHDKLIILGDFNARVGCDNDAWKTIIGPYGLGKMNSNGLRLLSLCSEFNLSISNTFFRQPLRNKASWMHPRSKHWHLLDYIIVRESHRSEICTTKAIPLSTSWSDHRLLTAKLSLRIRLRSPKSNIKLPKRLNVSPSSMSLKGKLLQEKLDEKLSRPVERELEDDVEAYWKSLRETVYESSAEVLGFVKRSHQDWFDENDEEIKQHLENMHVSHNKWINCKSSSSLKESYLRNKRKVQTELRRMKNEWWVKKSNELQAAADCKDSKNFHRLLKAIYGPKTNGTSPVLDLDGQTLLTDKSKVLGRWKQHFEDLLNRESTVDDNVINSIPQRPLIETLSVDPTLPEVEKAVKQLISGKAPGNDGLPPEIFKSGGKFLLKRLRDLFVLIWKTGSVPQDFKDASIIHLYKNKGARNVCDNHRGISLLSVAGKILARVILNRIIDKIVPGVYPESQCGFRSGRGTVDMVFALRQVQEKAREQNSDLYMVFIDLTKAFDTVNREALWKVLQKLGLPDIMIQVIISLHFGMKGSVRVGGEISETFNVTNGTKQGCVMAPVLFALFFSVMLETAFEDCSDGIDIEFRTSGGLFKQKRLNSKTKITRRLIRELLFADDCALVAKSLIHLQNLVNRFSSAAKAFGLTISLKKTEVLYQPKPNSPHSDPKISIGDFSLKSARTFTYLGSRVNSTATLDDELALRISKASSSFGRLRHRLWDDHGIRLKTKINVYHSVVIPTLLYASETWTLYRKQINMLDAFHMRCLRSILGISWKDKWSNEEVLSKCNSTGIECMLIKSQFRWIGHVIRMDDSRIPKSLLYGQFAEGSRKIGRPLLRYRDKIKSNVKVLDLQNDWENMCLDRSKWRSTMHDSLKSFETNRLSHRAAARQSRRAPPTSPQVPCPNCNFKARSNAGLAAHKRFKHR